MFCCLWQLHNKKMNSYSEFKEMVLLVTRREFLSKFKQSKGGAVVRTLASHQCGSGVNVGIDSIHVSELRLLLVLGFSPSTPVFPSA